MARSRPAAPTTPTAVPRWATQEDTAEYMRCSQKTVRRYLASGKLTGYRLGDRFLRIDLNEVDADAPDPLHRPVGMSDIVIKDVVITSYSPRCESCGAELVELGRVIVQGERCAFLRCDGCHVASLRPLGGAGDGTA